MAEREGSWLDEQEAICRSYRESRAHGTDWNVAAYAGEAMNRARRDNYEWALAMLRRVMEYAKQCGVPHRNHHDKEEECGIFCELGRIHAAIAAGPGKAT